MSNGSVCTQTKQSPTEEETRKSRWRWIGHTLKNPGSSITRKALG